MKPNSPKKTAEKEIKENRGLTRSGSAVIRVPAPPWDPATIEDLQKKASDYIEKKRKKSKK